MENKIKEQTYILNTDETIQICGYIAYSCVDRNKRDFDFKDHDIVDIRRLELKYLTSLEKNKPEGERKIYDLDTLYYHPDSISYFFIWADGVAQIGFITDTIENSRVRMLELQRMLEYGGFRICQEPIPILNEIPR